MFILPVMKDYLSWETTTFSGRFVIFTLTCLPPPPPPPPPPHHHHHNHNHHRHHQTRQLTWHLSNIPDSFSICIRRGKWHGFIQPECISFINYQLVFPHIGECTGLQLVLIPSCVHSSRVGTSQQARVWIFCTIGVNLITSVVNR